MTPVRPALEADRYRRVRVTHPFHPLYGRDFEFVARRQNWGEDRVHLHDEKGRPLEVIWLFPQRSRLPRT
jgi:hypothetical protein